MVFVIDFDGTVVHLDAPLRLKPGARKALLALKTAGHTLLLFSARSNRARRFNEELDPLFVPPPVTLIAVAGKVMAQLRDPDVDRLRVQAYNEALHRQMVDFVNRELPGVFDAIDDGTQGKPVADYYIDDKSLNPALPGYDWEWIGHTFGEPELDAAPQPLPRSTPFRR
jgi:hydroxymethylpyrimidine pyrophosphatase-like HAD family hydrolase